MKQNCSSKVVKPNYPSKVISHYCRKLFKSDSGPSVCSISDSCGSYRFIYFPFAYWSDRLTLGSLFCPLNAVEFYASVDILFNLALTVIRHSLELDDSVDIDLSSYYFVFGGNVPDKGVTPILSCVSCTSFKNYL